MGLNPSEFVIVPVIVHVCFIILAKKWGGVKCLHVLIGNALLDKRLYICYDVIVPDNDNSIFFRG